MNQDSYKPALSQAKKDLEAAIQKRQDAIKTQDEADEEIADLRQTVAVLSKLCGEEVQLPKDEFGLTDAIRMALKTYGSALNAVQVRTRLEQLGYDVTSSESSLPAIHTVLKRLVLKGELDDSASIDNKTAYRWIKK